MVQAVLQELGIATPGAHRESLGSTDTSSAVSIDDSERPSSARTDGSERPSSMGTDSAPSGPGRRGDSKRPASPGIGDMALTAAELQELSRYFPSVAKDAVFCVGCASYGHSLRFCPLRTCRICNACIDDHALFGCPALSPTDVVFRKIAPLKTASIKKGKNKNRKGKGKGKETEQSIAEADWVPEPDNRPAQKCKLCLEVTAHRDVCPMLWTTFVPNPCLKRKAGQISVSCYFCGSGGHFGGDCSKNKGEHLSGRQFSRPDDIWCQKYAQQFMGGVTPDSKTPHKAPVASSANGVSEIARPANAKRAKTSADQNTLPGRPKPPQAPSPAQVQKNTSGQPGAPALSKTQIKKANRRQRLADEARGVLAKQTAQASKASQDHYVLPTALPTRTGPPSAPHKGQKQAPKSAPNRGPKQPPRETPTAGAPMAIKGIAGTSRSAPVPAAEVYNLPQQKQPKTKQQQQQPPKAQKKQRKKPKGNAEATTATTANGQRQPAAQSNAAQAHPLTGAKAGPVRRRRGKSQGL